MTEFSELQRKQKSKCYVRAVLGRTPRALLARNEVNVGIWNSTPLLVPGWKSITTARVTIRRISILEGSVRQTLTQSSFTANALRGVLHHKETASSSEVV